MNAYQQHRTSDLLRMERVASTLAIRQELERRGYTYDARCGRYVKEPTRHRSIVNVRWETT